VRYAVVGLGYISQAAMLPAFAHARENSELVALVSSDPKKLRDLSRKYEVAHTYMYEQYADCLKSGAIDAVYIGLPNNMHRAYSEAAALAGVHVLCEKPMAFDEVDCEAMIGAAEQTKVKLMIAYRLHFERGNLEMMETIKSGKIGEPRIFNSVFSQQAAAGNSRLEARVGGGPLYDMGVYCINAARYLFRAEPDEVFAWNLRPENDERFREVPEMTAGLLKFPGDRVASFTSSFGAVDRSVYEVVGTKGALKMDPAYDMTGDLKAEISIGGRTKKRVFKKRDQFAAELAYFSDCVLRDKQPEPSGREGLEDVRIVRALLRSAESGKPVSLSRVETDRRPEMSQEIAKAPVPSVPKLVNAAPPAAD
jgi:glucose-fructose oxidoreductase